jgi:hypothetical protein
MVGETSVLPAIDAIDFTWDSAGIGAVMFRFFKRHTATLANFCFGHKKLTKKPMMQNFDKMILQFYRYDKSRRKVRRVPPMKFNNSRNALLNT